MQTPAHDTGFAESAGLSMFYRHFSPSTRGHRRAPILIVHGLSYFSYDWIDVAASLAADREVAAIDLRGFGQSQWSPSRDYSLRTFAADLIAVLDHLGWDRAVLMGHSMGGRICLCAAAAYPQRASSLVCVDFAPDVEATGRASVAQRVGNQPDVFETVDEALRYHGYPDEPADSPVRRRYEAFLEPSQDGFRLRRDLYFRDSFREVLRTGKVGQPEFDLWALLASLDVPSLFIRGSSSNMFGIKTLDKILHTNPRAQAIEIEGSHDLAGDNPAGVTMAVRRFLTSTEPLSPSAPPLSNQPKI